MKKGRLQGENPKVGIRPVIDARQGGVRESLEVQTMTMATNLATFLTSQLNYADGNPVECVIANTTIGRVDEAAACAEKFRKEGVGLTITVTPCWCYGSETIDYDAQMPKAIWGFNGTERPGAVYLAAALAGHTQKGLPAFGIYGRDVQDNGDTNIPADVQEKLLRFVKAGITVATMRGKSYLSIGSVSMGIAGSIVDTDFFQNYLGMRNESVDMTEVLRRIQQNIFDPVEFEKAMQWTDKYCKPREGTNFFEAENHKTREDLDLEWEFVVKMTLIMRDLMTGNPRLRELGFAEEALGHNAIVAGFQGQRQWTDFLPNGDFAEAVLNSSFDWNGIREAYVVATENDALNGVSMLFGKLLTNAATVFADVRTYWSPDAVKRVSGYTLTGAAKDGLIHLINSGSAALDGCGQQEINGAPAMKPFTDIIPEEAERCLNATTWYPANTGYFRGGGFSSKFLTRGGMPITLVRLNLVKGLGPVLQLAEGWSVDIPTEVHNKIDERTDRTWPTTWFAPRLTGEGMFSDVYSVMNNWGANHGAFSYGHVGADLITLASMLRIPVCMHNVPNEQIFRPSAWASFGMNPEGADYRACQTYGPLY